MRNDYDEKLQEAVDNFRKAWRKLPLAIHVTLRICVCCENYKAKALAKLRRAVSCR